MSDKGRAATHGSGLTTEKKSSDREATATSYNAEKAPPRIDFIDTLRGLAVLLVLWDHLVGHYLMKSHLSWWPHSVIHMYVNVPLGIIQDFGWFGVCLFFLVSGYVITHVAQRETVRQFTIRRLLRIYPPLALAILLAMLLAPGSGESVVGDWSKVLWGMTLLNYLIVPQNVVLGVGWTLVIEMLFYSLVALQTLWFRSRPRMSVFLNLAVCAATIACCRKLGDSFFLLAASIAFIPYLVLGQIFYLRSRGIVGNRFLMTAVVTAFAVAQYGIREIHTDFLPLNNSYLLSFVVAMGVFVIAMLVNLRPSRAILFSAQISYSLYLVHGPVGFAALGLSMRWGAPYSIALCLAIAAVFGVAYALHRLVERPSRRLARQWTESRAPKVPQGKAPVLSP
ncbi:exopolysaccharide production protein ExoZ [Variovorax paradoxus]|jgi:peptidoglycan/LPS O-acetylase OafA/YrhL|nr:exopolysaccharide production protein ExoZ [Variovorax paradoxus]